MKKIILFLLLFIGVTTYAQTVELSIESAISVNKGYTIADGRSIPSNGSIYIIKENYKIIISTGVDIICDIVYAKKTDDEHYVFRIYDIKGNKFGFLFYYFDNKIAVITFDEDYHDTFYYINDEKVYGKS